MSVYRYEFMRPRGSSVWAPGMERYKEPNIDQLEDVVDYFHYWDKYEFLVLPEARLVMAWTTHDGMEHLAVWSERSTA